MKNEKHPAFFERFTIWMTEEEALSGSHIGACDKDVGELLKTDAIKAQLETIPAEQIRQEVSNYGAWDEEELKGDQENLARIIWIACWNIREELRK